MLRTAGRAIGVGLTLAAAPASAQLLSFDLGPAAGAGVIDLATGATSAVTAEAAQVGSLYTADGAFALRQIAPDTLRLRHMPSGAQTTIATDFAPRLAHPRRHAVFGQSAGQPARFDARGLARWDRCPVPSTGSTWPMDLSVDGSTLFVLCGGDVIGLDSETGQETRRVAAAGLAVGFAVNAAATEAVGWRNAGVPSELVRIELASGQVLANRAVSALSYGVAIAVTPRRDRVVATSCQVLNVDVSCTPALVDLATLAHVTFLPSGASVGSGPSVAMSPDGHDAFVNGHDQTLSSSFATWVDVDSGAWRAHVSRTRDEGGIGIAYRPRPLPPVLASAQIAAHTVELAWALETASPMATRYVVEAGAAPGTTMVTLGAVGTTLSVPGAPPGRYYVRVRAVNHNGSSPPSNEIVVDVP